MALRRSRRLAGLSPEVLDDVHVKFVDVQKELVTAGFTGTVISLVVFSCAVFMMFWK